LPFRDGCFDALLSLDVLVHFEAGEEARVIEEFAQVLRPGGLLIVRVAALNILRSRHSEFIRESQRFMGIPAKPNTKSGMIPNGIPG
jgi:SAM-dependent methyltransferase